MKMNITKKEKIINIVMFLTVLTVGWFYYFSQFMSFDKPLQAWLLFSIVLLI